MTSKLIFHYAQANGEAESSNKIILIKLVKKIMAIVRLLYIYGATNVTPFELRCGQYQRGNWKKMKALMKIEKKTCIAKAYNKKMKNKLFHVGDMDWKTSLPLGTKTK